jgi:hypothetical protein
MVKPIAAFDSSAMYANCWHPFRINISSISARLRATETSVVSA